MHLAILRQPSKTSQALQNFYKFFLVHLLPKFFLYCTLFIAFADKVPVYKIVKPVCIVLLPFSRMHMNANHSKQWTSILSRILKLLLTIKCICCFVFNRFLCKNSCFPFFKSKSLKSTTCISLKTTLSFRSTIDVTQFDYQKKLQPTRKLSLSWASLKNHCSARQHYNG